MKFHIPKKNCCDFCVAYNNSPNKSAELIEKYDLHQAQKNQCRKKKEELKALGKACRNTLVAVFDLQKTFLCPHGDSSSFYYSLRLKLWNLSITNIYNMNTICYIWDESTAKKGSCEVSSCVFDYLNKVCQQGVKRMHFFCDRWSGQNNNRAILVMLSIAINLFQFEEITLNYLVTGHSQNENDSIHSTIEKFVSKRCIYSLEEWVTCVRMAFVKNEPKVKKLLCDDVIDFKRKESHSIFGDFLNTSKEKRFEVSSEDVSITSQKLYITKIMQAKFVKEKPNKMVFRYDFDGEPVNEFNLLKLIRHRSIAPLYSVESLPKLYNEEP